MKQYMQGKWFERWFFIVATVACLVLSNSISYPGGKRDGQGRFWCDNAGYYVYLPALFLYDFDAKQLPDGIDKRTCGFVIDHKKNKLYDKYTYGEALLLAPFFLVTHLVAQSFDPKPDGFSLFYEKMMTIPAVFYLILGLFFLRRFLVNYLEERTTYLVILFVVAGTNLYHYALHDCLMSHVYSFFLFSLCLYFLKKFLDKDKKPYKLYLLFCLAVALSVLTRPTNLVIISLLAFLDTGSFREAGRRIVFFLHPKYSLPLVAMIFILYLPQMFYWHYVSGSYIHYSYENEVFSNLGRPMMIPIWFSPLNGLFLYNPMVLLFIAGVVLMIVRKIRNGIFIGLLFLFMSYVFASWEAWYFGGAFGSRPFIEFYTILGLPFGYFLQFILSRRNLFIRNVTWLTLFVFCWYNLMFIYHYTCYTGSIWSWDEFVLKLDACHLYKDPRNTYTYINDFENPLQNSQSILTHEAYHSKTLGLKMDTLEKFDGVFSRKLSMLLKHQVTRVHESVWIKPLNPEKTKASFICSITDFSGKCIFYKSLPMDDYIRNPGEWTKIESEFYVPSWADTTGMINFYVWNTSKSKFFIDDMKIKFN